MADRFVNLFEPDTLLPAQYFAAFSREGGLVRERRLMLAVLQDAVECYQKYALARDPRGVELFRDANQWIESGERDWPFSYENVCEVLGLNPEYIRKGLSKSGALAGAFGVRLPINKRDEQGVKWVGYLLWEYLEPVLSRR